MKMKFKYLCLALFALVYCPVPPFNCISYHNKLDGVETREWGTRFQVAFISDDDNGVTTTQELLNQKAYLITAREGNFYVIKFDTDSNGKATSLK